MREDNIDDIPISSIEAVIGSILVERRINPGKVTIREIDMIRKDVTEKLHLEMVGMDMGIPGLPTPPIIIKAQRAAITGKNCSEYSGFDGLPVLKEATADFLEAYAGIRVAPKNCIPTVGGMHGCKVNIGITGKINPEKDTLLFLVPGFSVNALQAQEFGVKTKSIDIHGKYGHDLVYAIETELQAGNIGGILWSSPNNPTWRVLSDRELKGIGKLCTKYDVIGIEDAAYFGLDSRMKERRTPGEAPYFPTIAHHTDLWVMILSGSKIFNYAGERIGVSVLSERVAEIKSEHLRPTFARGDYWNAFVQGGLYSSVASVGQSAQRALAAAFSAAIDKRKFDYFEYDKPYEERAKRTKEILTANGFTIPYDRDDRGRIGHGYYFTAAHPAFASGEQLAFSMIKYGMTAVPLVGFGGTKTEGVRICCSKVKDHLFRKLEERTALFTNKYQTTAQKVGR